MDPEEFGSLEIKYCIDKPRESCSDKIETIRQDLIKLYSDLYYRNAITGKIYIEKLKQVMSLTNSLKEPC